MSFLDIIRPNWKKSDPVVRANAVERELNDQGVIDNLATTDPDERVRTAAVKKIVDLKLLKTISQNDSKESVKNLAKNRYQEEAFRKLKNVKEISGDDRELLNDLKDTHYADDLLKSASSDEIRKELVGNCKKANVLATIANRDLSEEIAAMAAQKVDSDALMADIAKNSRHTSVRKLVSEKIRAKRDAEDNGKKAQALLESKRDAIIGQAHHLAAQKNPLSVRAQFDGLMDEAKALGMEDKQSTLDEIYASFNKFCDEADAQRVAAEKAAAEKAEKKANLASGLEELEHLIIDNQISENSTRVDEIIAQWNENKSLMDASLIKRFNNAFFKVQEIQKPVIVETDGGEANDSARPELLDRLQALADTDVNESTSKYLHAIVREWEKLPLLEGEDPALQAYNAIRNKLSEKITAFNESAQKIFEENSIKLRGIIDKVKSFNENEDFRELNKKVRDCYQQWKEIVGEQKFKYHDLWQEYKEATSRFQEMQQWENWRNEQARDEILVEMDKMAQEEPSQPLFAKLREISNRWREIGPVSAIKFQEYRDRFQANYEKIKEKCAPFIEEMNAERIKNLADKESICQKIEELVANTEMFWKDKFKTMQELQESWKNIGMVPKENVAALTERFKTAANAFYTQHKENLKVEDAARESNYEKKLALCIEAEAIKDSTDWNATSNKFKQLQESWKSTGPVPKSKSDEVWNRFRIACDTFFEKKRAHFEEMDANKQKNLDAKNQVCQQLEDMESAGQGTLDEIKALEEKFKSLGMVPKESIEAISERFNTIYNKILIRLAGADETLSQALAEIRTKKQEMVEKVKQFAESAGSNQLADAVREIQKEWREIGSCGEGDSELYKKFREVCDDFFTRRRDQLDIQEQARKNNLQKKLLLCEQAEDLLKDLNEATVVSSMNKVKHLRRLWKEVGAVPREHSEKTWNRFNTACDQVFAFGRKDEPKEPSEAEDKPAEGAEPQA